MAFKVITPSTVEAVPVDDLKDHLRITSTSEDILLRRYIQVATRQCEHLTQRQLTTATVQLTLSELTTAIELPQPPIKSTSVQIEYVDSSGATATMGSSIYEVDTYSDGPAVVRLAYGQEWPDLYDTANAVRIRYVAGYPVSTVDGEQTVPWEMKLWVMMTAGAYYEHRESLESGYNASKELPRGFLDSLLDPYIVHNVGGF